MSIQELQTSRLDINNNYEIDLTFKQLDDISFKIVVYDKSLPADLSNYTARLKAFKPDQIPLIQNTKIYINDNVVTIKGDPQLGTTSGITKAELQFINKTTLEKKSTFYININVIASVLETERGISVATCTLLKEIENALDKLENIGEVLVEATEVNDELEDTTIPSANTAKANLELSIDDANASKLALDQSKTTADNSKLALDLSITNAKNSKDALDLSKNSADNSKEALDESIEEANNFVQAHQNIENLVNQVNQNTAQMSENTQQINNLNVNKADKADINTIATEKADQSALNTTNETVASNYSTLDIKINSQATGSPKGTFPTVTDLTTAYPSGNTNIYVVTADGNWYYWNGSAWVSGGVYQATSIANKSVSYKNLSDLSFQNLINKDNIINDILYDLIYEGWSGSAGGWFYNWDATTVRNITQSTNKLYNNMPSLNIKITNATSITKWVGHITKSLTTKKYKLKFSYYVASGATNAGGKINAYGADLFTFDFVNCTKDTWNNVELIFTPTSLSEFIFRIYTFGNSDFYISPVIIKECDSLIGLDTKETLHNLTEKVKDTVKDSIEILSPNRIYNVANNRTANHTTGYQDRQYATPMYLDYLVNKETDIMFKGSRDNFIFTSPVDIYGAYNSGNNVLSRDISVPLESENYDVSDLTVKQVTTVASATANKMFVLCIGDSQTEDGLSQGWPYWMQCADLFKREDMDFWRNTESAQFLGTRKYYNTTIENYQSQTKSYEACCEGRAGWTLYSYLRHQTQLEPNATNYALLGFSDTWTGSDTQKDAIASKGQSFSGTPSNPFFDNSKSSEVKFSILKWLERYRTLDDSGNKLTLGSGTGTLITSDNINQIKVCTPTHVFIRLGQNDFGKCTDTKYRANVLALINAIRTELPNAYIIIGLAIPSMGTWHPERYPDWIDLPTPEQSYWYNNAKYWSNYFKSYDQEGNKVFLLEDYYFTPITDGFYCYRYSDGFLNNTKLQEAISTTYYKKPYGDGYKIHPNQKANFMHGYHLYSLLKYIQTLS